jgi:hypothetical protein
MPFLSGISRTSSRPKKRPSPLQRISGWAFSIRISHDVPDLARPITKKMGASSRGAPEGAMCPRARASFARTSLRAASSFAISWRRRSSLRTLSSIWTLFPAGLAGAVLIPRRVFTRSTPSAQRFLGSAIGYPAPHALAPPTLRSTAARALNTSRPTRRLLTNAYSITRSKSIS